MFSSIRNDPGRLRKEAEMSSYTSRYHLCMPGPGIDAPIPDDIHVGLQTWAGNWASNRIDLESDLHGQTRVMSRDHLNQDEYRTHATAIQLRGGDSLPKEDPTHSLWQHAVRYTRANPFVEESRASHPAWMFRGVEIPRWVEPWLNPQALSVLEKPFETNIQTKMLDRDAYMRQTMS